MWLFVWNKEKIMKTKQNDKQKICENLIYVIIFFFKLEDMFIKLLKFSSCYYFYYNYFVIFIISISILFIFILK